MAGIFTARLNVHPAFVKNGRRQTFQQEESQNEKKFIDMFTWIASICYNSALFLASSRWNCIVIFLFAAAAALSSFLSLILCRFLFCSIMSTPYDTSAEADLLYSLIVKARFENNRYQKPKKQPKASTKHVDWF